MGQSVRLGVFVVITLAILGLFVFLVGSMESKFQANYRLQAQFQNVSGLDEGADVRVGGLHEGTVRKIALPSNADGKMTIVMDLSRSTRNLIKKDSLASIKSEGLVGDKYVEISFGSQDSPAVRSGDTIGSEAPIDISDLIAKTNQILDSTKGALDNFQAATQNVDSITAKINNGNGTVGALINNKAMYQQATAGVAAMREDADALKHNLLLRGYFNQKGFADPEEIQKQTIARLPDQRPSKAFAYNASHLFDKPDSAKLKDQKALNEAGAYLQNRNPGLVVVEASAGPKGDSDKDRELSQARAYAIRSYLIDHFKLDDSHLKIVGLGKTENDASLRILIYDTGSGTGRK
jgi:phospholipid/cholesterol/gamma-HCH transport system substrate-binding protein